MVKLQLDDFSYLAAGVFLRFKLGVPRRQIRAELPDVHARKEPEHRREESSPRW